MLVLLVLFLNQMELIFLGVLLVVLLEFTMLLRVVLTLLVVVDLLILHGKLLNMLAHKLVLLQQLLLLLFL